MNLPIEFQERMQHILGREYEAFLQSYEEPRKYGLRVNTKKISPEEFEQIAPFHLTKIPWLEGCYYYQEGDAPARHPFYHAGLYYLQEPTAMTPASVLPVEPGQKVLDLCAAPGGKATALGAKLRGEGLLVANDISASRAKALLKNIEVFGIPNIFVTNAVPARLEERFPAFFDRILVDAPCSGEGMFRKDEDTIKAWYPEKPAECAKIQKDLIVRAADMLQADGQLLYSTCTFAPQENEEVIVWLLEQRPEMELLEIPFREGFSKGLDLKMLTAEEGASQGVNQGANQEPGLEKPGFPERADLTRCVRLWPHKIGGEGHFMALLHKRGGTFLHCEMTDVEKPMREKKPHKSPKLQKSGSSLSRLDKSQQIILREFLKASTAPICVEQLEVRGSQIYDVSSLLPDTLAGIPFLRNGLYLGELKKDRFEPSQSFAMALDAEEYQNVIELQGDDERLIRYLKGETVEITSSDLRDQKNTGTGWQLVCANKYPLGWGKLVNGMLKNKYLAGWRMK